jgi:hypothetical protein
MGVWLFSDRDTGFLSEPECGASRLRSLGSGNNSSNNNGTNNNNNNKYNAGRNFAPGTQGRRNICNSGVSFDSGKRMTQGTASLQGHHRELFLDFDTDRAGASSPPSDSGGIFGSHCFATTPRFDVGCQLLFD